MPHGRRVRVEPKEYSSEFSSAAGPRPRPPSHALGPFYVLGVKEAQQKEGKAAATAVSSAAAAISAMSALKGYTGNDKPPPASGNAGGAAGGGATAANDDLAGGGESADDPKVKNKHTRVNRRTPMVITWNLRNVD